MKNNLYIFGTSSFGEVAFNYFERENKYNMKSFIADEKYIEGDSIHGKPLITTESFLKNSDPSKDMIFIAIVYTDMNRKRTEKFDLFKKMGYHFANYISENSYIDETVVYGENVFIFENNVIQYGTKIGNNCIFWSGNHIGHHNEVKDNCFISSHVVISGHCVVGENTFIGVNSTIGNDINIGKDNWINSSCNITNSTPNNAIYVSEKSKRFVKSATDFFKVNEN
jgi:sugar O-acyltransferase (sialic acid O-acetyltransferase NeuD family)